MPDEIRARSAALSAGRRRGRYPECTTAMIFAVIGSDAAGAAEPSGLSFLQPYFAALAALERHEIAALALTLGTIFFSVVTAIALLRTHARAARARATARAEIARLRDDVDRATALLLS